MVIPLLASIVYDVRTHKSNLRFIVTGLLWLLHNPMDTCRVLEVRRRRAIRRSALCVTRVPPRPTLILWAYQEAQPMLDIAPVRDSARGSGAARISPSPIVAIARQKVSLV
jgi:hypothetical protein